MVALGCNFKQNPATKMLTERAQFDLDPQITDLISPEIARQYRVLPLKWDGNSLVLIAEKSLGTDELDAIGAQIKHPVALATEQEFRLVGRRFSVLLNRHYPAPAKS